MEIDVQFKTASNSLSFTKDKSEGIWKFSKYTTTDWNHEYFLIEKTVYELSIFVLHFTWITSKVTDKKWTDKYVTSLDKFAEGLAKNEEQVLNFVEAAEVAKSDPNTRLKIISKGKASTEYYAPSMRNKTPINVIEDFLNKENSKERLNHENTPKENAKTLTKKQVRKHSTNNSLSSKKRTKQTKKGNSKS